MGTSKYFVVFCVYLVFQDGSASTCNIPTVLQGVWFSKENDYNTITKIGVDSLIVTRQEQQEIITCLDMHKEHNSKYLLVVKKNACFSCLKIYVRTNNVLERTQDSCINVPEYEASVKNVCKNMEHNQKPLITLYNKNYNRVNCKNSIQGGYTFAYKNLKQFTGECNQPDSTIVSCPVAGDYKSLIINDKFSMSYKACKEIEGISDKFVEYDCLGDWFVNKNHYFAVANSKEVRSDKQFKCLLKNDDEENIIGISSTGECNTLKSPKRSLEAITIKPVFNAIKPNCQLSKNFAGQWKNNVNIDINIQINGTHIIETNVFDGKQSNTTYICIEKRDNMVFMAKISVQGCHHENVCFDFLPEQKNVIRYRTSTPTVRNHFESVCNSSQFPKENHLYNYYLRKHPQTVRCPFGGKFNFTQNGDFSFEQRYEDAVTDNTDIICKGNTSVICAACNSDEDEIYIGKNGCLDNLYGTDDYEKSDLKLKCIGYWKENEKSYLITYDKMDPLYQYHCWVYDQVTNSTDIIMSQAIGSYCALNQTPKSFDFSEGATVSLKLQVLDGKTYFNKL